MGDIDGDSSLTLLLQAVHDVGQTEPGLPLLCGELLVLLDDVLLDVSAVEEETPNGRGLPVVNVADEHDVAVWLALVFPF